MKTTTHKVDCIIFDNDGTLFQADLVSFPAIVSAYKDLMKIHEIKLSIPSKDKINAQIGLPAYEYFKNLLPKEIYHLEQEFIQLCIHHEVLNIEKGLGSLYPDVRETIIELKYRGYKLGVISNAETGYFNAVAEYFKYNDLFDAYICLGERTNTTKKDLLKELLDHFQSKQGAMVGDKFGDIEAGDRCNCLTVACMYGYGNDTELKSAHEKISKFTQILNIFK